VAGPGPVAVDALAKLDEIVASVESARAMPMSASCLVNRGELLARLDELREALPAELARARQLLAEREAVLDEARQSAGAIVAAADAERDRLLADTDIVAAADQAAQRRRADAEAEAARMRLEVDEYIDAKLAHFEVLLAKTLRAVERGRLKLAGEREELDDVADGRVDPPGAQPAGPGQPGAGGSAA
jgi:multidrug efflux pump subunit AcrA (membrane-fusion protein)